MNKENLLIIEWSEKTVSIFDRSNEDIFNSEKRIETPIATVEIIISEFGYKNMNATKEIIDAIIYAYKQNVTVEYSDYTRMMW